LAATAADSDGTIAKVEFYQGATLVGTATGAPFTASVSGLIAGTYTFTAKATDNQGISTTSSPVSVIVNSPPTVSVSAPTNNAIFNAPASINLTAVAADTDGTIAKVDFYNGSNLIGTVTANPFTYAWTAIPAGNYVITAKATDDRGSTKLSAAVAVTVNAPPTVAITAPLNNAVVVSPGNITLTATASDSDGSIAKVEFYQGPALVGTATAAPYSVSLSGLASGAYTFTANATDDRGAVTVSAPVTILVDAAPTITLTAPAPNTVIAAPGSLTLSANAGDADGTVAKVDFYQGATLVGTVLTPPYSVNVSGLAPGSYSFSAVVTDNFGVTSSSAPVTVIVESAPVVSITAPADGTVVNAPGSIVLTASASDSDGTVSKVDFYNGTTIIGTVTAAPYSVTWANVAAGTYAVSAKATDNQGLSTTSSAVTFIVNAPPTIAITSPVNNSTIAAPANVSITTNAQDSDGTLSKVDYYQGGVLIGTVTAAPYTFNWTNVGQGSYVLTAIATDNYGAQATSGAIAITVAPPAAKVYYVHADHLGTPRAITRPSDNAVVWKWENSDPFGNNAPNEDPSNLGVTTKYNLRFPGQYYDMETGTYYNYFRDYDPLLGRYGQSDPIGLSGGINTYTYVKARPLMLIDPNGLTSVDLNKPAPWTGSCTVAQHSLLQGSVNVACSVARTCKSTQTCRELGSNLFKLQACLKARLLINNTCYAGGDAGHKEAAQNERRGMETCAYWINKKCTTPPNCE
jgi:RHS repeat-associated protein